MKKRPSDHCLPFWTKYTHHWAVFWACIIAASFCSVCLYLNRLLLERDLLLGCLAEGLTEEIRVSEFTDLLPSRFLFPGRMILFSGKPVFLPLLLLVVVAVILAVYHYAALGRGAKSGYLMARLSDRREVHRRCLTLPLLMILAAVVLAALLLGVFYLLYRWLIPAPYGSPVQWAQVWQALPNFFFPFSPPPYVYVS